MMSRLATVKEFLLGKPFLFVVLAYIVMNSIFIGSYPPVDYTGDESWYMNYSIELMKTGRVKGSMFPFAGDLNEGNMLTPWLYSGTLAAFFVMLGKGLWQGRLLSLLCGLFTICITFRIGKKFHAARVGIAAAAFLGTSIFFTWSMREVRPEGMFTMVLTGGYYFFYRFLCSSKGFHIFLSSLLTGLLIEVHPNGVAACLSLLILYLVLYRKVLHRNTLCLLLGFGTPVAAWFFANYLPYEQSGLVSFQTVHRLYMPPLVKGDLSGFWASVKGHFTGLRYLFLSSDIYLNNVPLGVPFFGVATVLALRMVMTRRNLRILIMLVVTPLSLWLSLILVTSQIFQLGYLTYFMPSFALLMASSLFELRERYEGRKAVSYFVAVLIWVIMASNLLDASETNLRLREYKGKYDFMLKRLERALPRDAAILGSTNYYQAFLGSDRYYTWTFIQERCPDFGMTADALKADYVILDDILKNLSVRWCGESYYELQIVPFLKEQSELVGSIDVGYPNFNGADNFLRDIYIFKVKRN